MQQQPIRVVVADDHPVILFGAEHALLKFPGIQVIARARQSTELIKALQTTPCDVLVTDLAMPGGQYGDGLPLIGYLRRNFPEVPIVVLTMLENAALLKRLGELGVIAVVHKSDDLSHIGLAVQHVSRNLEYMSPQVRIALESLRINSGGKMDEVILSKRELEVVRLFVSGMTIKEISEKLNRSIKTISTQKNTAMRKLGLDRDSELFQYAQSNGLLNLSSHAPDEGLGSEVTP
ncbi:LuxR family two component transcriptional regulator [Paraburkholderia eburnea]|uniref:LuxR family two component transcriptional regulator n=1 Tax=Paraburkholderia eburnea TaxID=1189126 RepID=A0A2S4LSW7_9BURK|nr:response regulator transcription factor [Paraburkholderia eburnea]POR45524.1 LuxR family two component transcriptional regulator [Paraburkholderia eburnea]PRZ13792.1 LuxR family two component transcriptional regulator [Paraburkholderia eburnea]